MKTLLVLTMMCAACGVGSVSKAPPAPVVTMPSGDLVLVVMRSEAGTQVAGPRNQTLYPDPGYWLARFDIGVSNPDATQVCFDWTQDKLELVSDRFAVEPIINNLPKCYRSKASRVDSNVIFQYPVPQITLLPGAARTLIVHIVFTPAVGKTQSVRTPFITEPES